MSIEIKTVKRLNDFLEMDWDDDRIREISEEYTIHSLSTYIFDNYGHGEEMLLTCLTNLQKNFPEYFVRAVTGFLQGRHDT